MVNKEIKELLYKLAPSGFIVSLDLETTGVDNSKDKICLLYTSDAADE